MIGAIYCNQTILESLLTMIQAFFALFKILIDYFITNIDNLFIQFQDGTTSNFDTYDLQILELV